MEERITPCPESRAALLREIQQARAIVTAVQPHASDPAEDQAIRAIWREVLLARMTRLASMRNSLE